MTDELLISLITLTTIKAHLFIGHRGRIQTRCQGLRSGSSWSNKTKRALWNDKRNDYMWWKVSYRWPEYCLVPATCIVYHTACPGYLRSRDSQCKCGPRGSSAISCYAMDESESLSKRVALKTRVKVRVIREIRSSSVITILKSRACC